MADHKRRIGELEDELKRRDERIRELRDDIDKQRELIGRMREALEHTDSLIGSGDQSTRCRAVINQVLQDGRDLIKEAKGLGRARITDR